MKTTLTYITSYPHVHTCVGKGLPWLPLLRLSQNHPGECASACTTFQHTSNMDAHLCRKGTTVTSLITSFSKPPGWVCICLHYIPTHIKHGCTLHRPSKRETLAGFLMETPTGQLSGTRTYVILGFVVWWDSDWLSFYVICILTQSGPTSLSLRSRTSQVYDAQILLWTIIWLTSFAYSFVSLTGQGPIIWVQPLTFVP